MNMCLKMLFTLSLSGTALILVLLGATRIFGSHMGRRWQYYIWLAAVLRLLLPIPSPAGLIFPDALSSGMSAGLLSDGGNLYAWMDGRSGSGNPAGQPESVMGVRPGTGTERLAETGDMEEMAFTVGDTAKADTAKAYTAKAPGLYLFLLTPVSYTHLDVYKRQEYNRVRQAAITQEITEVISGAKAQKKKQS